MLFNSLTASALFVAGALASAEPAPVPYKLAKMSLNQAFGLMGRQDSGYAPTQTLCGPGADCPSSCGANTAQCPSSDSQLHCYTPSEGQACCPDGYGNACDSGYYCTDNSDGTWCCPNGLSLTDCAAFYTITNPLTSEAPTAAPATSSVSPTTPASVSVTASSGSSTVSPYSPYIPYSPSVQSSSSTTSTKPYPTTAPTKSSVGTTSSTATTTAVQFTGAANQLAYGGLPALALAAGAVLAL